MNLISTSWTCHRCGGAFISTPPEYGLCDQCVVDLETLARAGQPGVTDCPVCGGPVCPDCGQRMTLLVPAAPGELAALRSHLEASGDGN